MNKTYIAMSPYTIAMSPYTIAMIPYTIAMSPYTIAVSPYLDFMFGPTPQQRSQHEGNSVGPPRPIHLPVK